MYDNYNYPMGADNASAPWNDPDVPEEEFGITCSQTLSKTVTVWTNDYIPGASGVDYEPDDEGGYCTSSWHDEDDTSNTNWAIAYEDNDHYTPIQLIQLFKEHLQKELDSMEKLVDDCKSNGHSPIRKLGRALDKATESHLKHLIEECSSWTEDETEFVEE